MDVVVHRVRLREDTDAGVFEEWVRETDYASCRELPSVVSFSVQRFTGGAAEEPRAHYFEVIAVTSGPEFERDTKTETFRRLADEFDVMAEVVGEWSGERIGPGYAADPADANEEPPRGNA
ncbi:RedY protein [Streptomyces sp. TRM76323]|uniref:RedY protein n=1 Tax=Streptomyces tamarix TaxID=3078565 RepID=A0ABU3QJ78_9ACTN|nr:RedY protein [Streptomyces tamarix]MDT9682814.1 RedY protein [Streptomyces tamarix]